MSDYLTLNAPICYRNAWFAGRQTFLGHDNTRYTNFRPETLVGWHRRFVKRWWWMLVIAGGKRRTAGRPRVDASVEKIIADIKADNPSYGSKRISLMVTVQLGVEVSQTTVRNILKRQQRHPDQAQST